MNKNHLYGSVSKTVVFVHVIIVMFEVLYPFNILAECKCDCAKVDDQECHFWGFQKFDFSGAFNISLLFSQKKSQMTPRCPLDGFAFNVTRYHVCPGLFEILCGL